MNVSEGPRGPVKWRKYLLLAQFGFLTLGELEKEIVRFPLRAWRRVLAAIAADLAEARKSHRVDLFVVKLVLPSAYGQLPNLVVQSRRDLRAFPAFLRAHRHAGVSEIWYCRTRVDNDVFSVAGRLLFYHGKEAGQLLEQVWRCSPRNIERYSAGLKWPYARARRYSWGWPYQIEHVHVPPGKTMDSSQLAVDLKRSFLQIESAREKMERFCDFLEGFGYSSYSLEYKIIGETLRIIDWDTPDDRKVLEASNV